MTSQKTSIASARRSAHAQHISCRHDGTARYDHRRRRWTAEPTRLRLLRPRPFTPIRGMGASPTNGKRGYRRRTVPSVFRAPKSSVQNKQKQNNSSIMYYMYSPTQRLPGRGGAPFRQWRFVSSGPPLLSRMGVCSGFIVGVLYGREVRTGAKSGGMGLRKMTKRLIVSRYDFRIAIRFRIACLKKTFCKKEFYHSLTCAACATAPSPSAHMCRCRRAKLPTNAMNLRCFGHPPDLQRPGRVLLPHRAHGNSIPADVVQAVERRARGDGPGIVV